MLNPLYNYCYTMWIVFVYLCDFPGVLYYAKNIFHWINLLSYRQGKSKEPICGDCVPSND